MISDIYIRDSMLHVGTQHIRCAIGKNGLTADKREGDNKTPLGSFPLRELFTRPDRVNAPNNIQLKHTMLTENMGWCDDSSHSHYNQRIVLPFSPSHEQLWRTDNCYDVIIPLGYNDAPAIPDKGSAIFFHLASNDYAGTEGCIAIARDDMLTMLPALHSNTIMHIVA